MWWRYFPEPLHQLTEEEVHHLRGVVRGGSDPQELLPTRHRGVVDGLDVDVMPGHQFVTDFCVFSSIGDLRSITAGAGSE